MRSSLLSNRLLSLLLLFSLSIAWSAGVSLAADAVRPNVVLIYTDDQGSIDTNVYGADDLITPHTDALARRGVRFTQMYAPAPICSASRAGLITGCFPARAGVPGNVSPTDRRTDMPNEQVTIAEMMRDAGYATGHVGKWHLGHGPTTTPLGQGFDQSFGHMGGCIDNYSHFFYWNGPNRHDLWRDGKEIWADGQFFPDLMVDECQKFIAANRERPFFLYWAINVPHYPLQGTDKWREKYQHLESPRDMYAAFVSTMDECVGKVLTQLDELGLTDNTLVIFQSDHGHSTEVRTFGGGGNAGPYRGAKQCLFEGGLRVPSIVALPGVIPENEVRDQMVVACDWLPTIAAICDVSPPQRKLDGQDILPVIQSSTATSPHSLWHWQFNTSWAVRRGDWKLIANPRDTSNKAPLGKDDKFFLSNLAKDIGEMRNVAKENPRIVKELKQLHAEYVADVSGAGAN